jgi:hypothetical protein
MDVAEMTSTRTVMITTQLISAGVDEKEEEG